MKLRCSRLVAGGAVLLMPLVTNAIPITGSIEFSGTATVDSGITGFVGYSDANSDPFSAPVVNSGTGSYLGVAAGTAATWTPFTFAPPAASISPLWDMTYNGVNYSFAATTMTVLDASAADVKIVGTGIAHITGFDDTVGTWEVDASNPQGGLTFSFGASTSVPDGGTTVLMLGAGLSLVAMLRRKLT